MISNGMEYKIRSYFAPWGGGAEGDGAKVGGAAGGGEESEGVGNLSELLYVRKNHKTRMIEAAN